MIDLDMYVGSLYYANLNDTSSLLTIVIKAVNSSDLN